MREDLTPVSHGHAPLSTDVSLGKPEKFCERFIVRENARRFRHFAELPVERFDRIRRVDHAPDLLREGVERRELVPMLFPSLEVHLVLRPLLLHGYEGLHTRFFGGGAVNRFEVGAELFLLFVGNVLHGVADLVDDAPLNDGIGEDGFDGFGKSGETVHAADEDILHAAISDLGKNLHPEFCPLAFTNPDAKHLLDAIHCDAEKNVGALAHNLSIVPHLKVNAIEVDDRVEGSERTTLPLLNTGKDFIRNGGNHVGRNGNSVDILQVGIDIPRRETFRIHGNDLFLDVALNGFALLHGNGLILSIAISGDIDALFPEARLERLPVVPVAAVAGVMPGGMIFRVTKVVRELRIEHVLERRGNELLGKICHIGDSLQVFDLLLVLLVGENLWGNHGGKWGEEVRMILPIYTMEITDPL